jgi:vanillate O-demethylase ferredoxin subunit
MVRYDNSLSATTVVATRPLTDHIVEIELAAPGPGYRVEPGSHIDVGVTVGGRTETRSYSLVSRPGEHALRIAVKRHPDSRGGSAYLHSLRSGDRIVVSRPNNLFPLDHTRGEYLLVAGGIGITPLFSMALTLAEGDADFRLVYLGRRRADLAYVDELTEALGDRLVVHLSATGERFDVTVGIDELSPDALLYVCGPIGLIDEARRGWAGSGRAPGRLRYETFGSSGHRPPERFTVRLRDHDREVVVEASESLLAALRRAGVDVASDCERGECGLCLLDVVEVDGELDHRDVFLSDRQRASRTVMCVCVSRVVGSAVLDALYRPDEAVV